MTVCVCVWWSARSESLDCGRPAAGPEGDIGPQSSAEGADKAAWERHGLTERPQPSTGETSGLLLWPPPFAAAATSPPAAIAAALHLSNNCWNPGSALACMTQPCTLSVNIKFYFVRAFSRQTADNKGVCLLFPAEVSMWGAEAGLGLFVSGEFVEGEAGTTQTNLWETETLLGAAGTVYLLNLYQSFPNAWMHHSSVSCALLHTCCVLWPPVPSWRPLSSYWLFTDIESSVVT